MSKKDAVSWERYKDYLEALASKQVNFDASRSQEYTRATGWNVDSYCVDLPPEPPGEPVSEGSWEVAKEIISNYEFPDARLITGFFNPDMPLEGRQLLLRGRFLGLSFLFGVRVTQVIDEHRHTELGPARVWGFAYHTLEGHFEMGQAMFSVWKYLNDGQVEFHFDAYSKTARIPNLFHRIGFRLFGRSLQKRFAKQILARMPVLVAQRLRHTTD